MKLRVLERGLKNFAIRAELAVHRRLGREFIPARVETFCIEPSSACNLKCRFCAYDKKQSSRVSMSQDVFVSCVEQALDLGYKEFHLTPCTGDVFMDKRLFEKLEFMDAHPDVRAYHFFTNFTIPTDAQIARLTSLRKLSRLTVSIYGHDEKNFVGLTKSTSAVYRRLLSNLETLLAQRGRWPFRLTIGFRSTFDTPRDESTDLLQMIGRFRRTGVRIHNSHGIYNNWGGMVSQADVAGLNLRILSSKYVFKSGACVKLFDSFQVTASGIVNGCSCRDAESTLRIGDLKEKPLREILSRDNPDYVRLIEEQQAGQFRDVCRHCDYYRSIYHQPSDFRRNKVPVQNREEFLGMLQTRRRFS